MDKSIYKKAVKVLIGYDKKDALNMDIEKEIITMLEKGYTLVSCQITSCENYSYIRYGVILMFKPIGG